MKKIFNILLILILSGFFFSLNLSATEEVQIRLVVSKVENNVLAEARELSYGKNPNVTIGLSRTGANYFARINFYFIFNTTNFDGKTINYSIYNANLEGEPNHILEGATNVVGDTAMKFVDFNYPIVEENQDPFVIVKVSGISGENLINAPLIWEFSKDHTVPLLERSFPITSANNVPLDSSVTMIFSEPMDRASVEKSFRLHSHPNYDYIVTGSFEWDDNSTRFRFTPDYLLESNKQYLYYLTSSSGAIKVRDINKNQFPDADYDSSNLIFTTVSDSVNPVLQFLSPSNNDVDVVLEPEMRIGFSEPMNETSIITGFHLLYMPDGFGGARKITVETSFRSSTDRSSFFMIPNENLFPFSDYELRMNTGTLTPKDIAGRTATTAIGVMSAGTGYSYIRFTTRNERDLPYVVTSYPIEGEKNFDPRSVIKIEFSHLMDKPSVESNITLKRISDSLDITFNYDFQWNGIELVLIPKNNFRLSDGEKYELLITSVAKDIYGNFLTYSMGGKSPSSWRSEFTAVSLKIESKSPDPNAVVYPGSFVQISFNKPMAPGKTESSFRLYSVPAQTGSFTGVTVEISGVFSWSNDYTTFYFTPLNPLNVDSNYIVKINFDGNAQDNKGNFLEGVTQWGFSVPDLTSPVVLETTPKMGDSNYALDGIIDVTFSKTMDPVISLGSGMIRLFNGNFYLSGDLSLVNAGKTIRFDPHLSFDENTIYTVTVSKSLYDTDRINLENDYEFSFKTGETSEVSLLSINGRDVQAGFSLGLQNILPTFSLQFSKDMNENSIKNSFQLVNTKNNEVIRSFNWSGSGNIFFAVPEKNLLSNVIYKLGIKTSGIYSTSGVNLSSLQGILDDFGDGFYGSTFEVTDKRYLVVQGANYREIAGGTPIQLTGSKSVPLLPLISVTFSEPVLPSNFFQSATLRENIDGANNLLDPDDFTGVIGVREISFNPYELESRKTYRLTIKKDLIGEEGAEGIEEDYSVIFETRYEDKQILVNGMIDPVYESYLIIYVQGITDTIPTISIRQKGMESFYPSGGDEMYVFDEDKKIFKWIWNVKKEFPGTAEIEVNQDGIIGKTSIVLK